MARKDAALVRAELEMIEAEQAYIEVKTETARGCSECGRSQPRSKAAQKKVDDAKKIMAAARVDYRTMRQEAKNAVT